MLMLKFRSIPACAGEPDPIQNIWLPKRVYPRVCGGTSLTRDTTPANSGLSPRVRGNPASAADVARRRGSIPACAGEPQAGSGTVIERRVYPRVCGGTTFCGVRKAICGGLSPRVRGNLESLTQEQVTARSIPACAGEPIRASIALPELYGLSPRVRGNRATENR